MSAEFLQSVQRHQLVNLVGQINQYTTFTTTLGTENELQVRFQLCQSSCTQPVSPGLFLICF
jgi:hypothetical protein